VGVGPLQERAPSVGRKTHDETQSPGVRRRGGVRTARRMRRARRAWAHASVRASVQARASSTALELATVSPSVPRALTKAGGQAQHDSV
jgi:hypothetical protein